MIPRKKKPPGEGAKVRERHKAFLEETRVKLQRLWRRSTV